MRSLDQFRLERDHFLCRLICYIGQVCCALRLAKIEAKDLAQWAFELTF